MSDPYGSRRFRPRELAGLLVDPGWADAEGAEWLVVDIDAGDDATGSRDLANRLAGIPIPLIGVGRAGDDSPMAAAMDLVVESESELAAVLAAIDANPNAAAVLVQVLRSSEKLPVLEALALESLAYATLQSGAEFARWLSAREQAPPVGASSSSRPNADPVQLHRRDSRLEFVLDTPDNRNALSTTMRDSLTEAFKLVAIEPGIAEVDVRANGPCFSSGGDLTEFGTAQDPAVAHAIRMRRMPARYLAPEAARYHFHVHGACIGAGIELAAFAGFLTATADAFFQLPETAMGLIPGAGGCVSIPRRIGRQRTAFMALTGRRIDASQALAWGLVDKVGE